MASLLHGLSSDDTYRWVFSALNLTVFERAFQQWIQTLVSGLAGDVIPIDEKWVRSAFRSDSQNVIHQVSTWSCQHQLVLGQLKTDDKSNEIITSRTIDLTRREAITLDAMGAQKAIAQQIIEQKVDYLLALKGNH